MQIGIAGIGFMGTTHFMAAAALEGARVGAIFTRDRSKFSGDWRQVKGNFGEGGGVHDLSHIRKYDRYEDMLADDQIDLVDICLPSHLHREAAEAALRAGKHVLVEKPIALNLKDADAMLATAEATSRRLFVAQVLRFFPEFRLIKQYQESGEYGRLLGLHLKRVISQPNWGTDWLTDPEKAGSFVIDLHIHDVDFVQYLFGMPQTVYAAGLRSQGDIIYVNVSFGFGDDVNVSANSGRLAVASLPFEHGYSAYFEHATLQFTSAFAARPRLWLPGSDEPQEPELPSEGAFEAQLQYVVDAVSGKNDGQVLAAASARNSLALCHAVLASVTEGRPVEVIGAK